VSDPYTHIYLALTCIPSVALKREKILPVSPGLSTCDKSINVGNTGKQKNILDLLRAASRVIWMSGGDIDSGVGVIAQ
jgi:hypothetical protein